MLAENIVFSSRFKENEIISFQGEEEFQLVNTRTKKHLVINMVMNMVRLLQETVYLIELLFLQTKRENFRFVKKF